MFPCVKLYFAKKGQKYVIEKKYLQGGPKKSL